MEITTLNSSSSSDPSHTMINVDDDITNSKKFDVFLNFRGEDTRKNILGHLRAALSEKGIKTFVDDDQLERGQYISPQLVQAIEDSSCSVIIISPNYASSSWCLDELVHILDCMRTKGQIVIPVFYHVDPSDVRKISGSFGEAIAKHEKNLEDDLERVSKWRVALTEVTSLAGLDSKNHRDEANFIREIVAEVSGKLTSKSADNDQCSSFVSTVLGLVYCIAGFLFFFLVVFPLFGLFVFKVVAPFSESVFGLGSPPNQYFDSMDMKCPDGMVPVEKTAFGFDKTIFKDMGDSPKLVCISRVPKAY